jgi:SAM-dependent methyltransferase
MNPRFRARKALSICRQFGFDPKNFLVAILALPRFILDALKFRIPKGGKIDSLLPALLDRRAESGSADGHYFWQDLICARWIYEDGPRNHFDVGSRVDGFVAHVASFREITILDIRPMTQKIPNVKVEIGDAQEDLSKFKDKFDSVSSLHSIEHFGLGRYGDRLEIDGHISGLLNIARCVKPAGTLYISFPLGADKVQFNSQRILNPNLIYKILPNFSVTDFVLIPWKGQPIFGMNPIEVDVATEGFAGLFKLRRES